MEDLESIPEYGDLFALNDFISACQDGMFTDYDGQGYYSLSDKMSRNRVNISFLMQGLSPKHPYTHIVWFNR